MKYPCIVFIFLSLTISAMARKNILCDFPSGYTPQEVGQRIAYHFVNSGHRFWGSSKWIGYHEVCAWNGCLMWGHAAGDSVSLNKMKERFDELLADHSEHLPVKNHVDLNMFGFLPLNLYSSFPVESNYRQIGLSYADTQWELPATAKEHEKQLAGKDIRGRHVCGLMTCI